jgi:phenylacetaldehyde dehydrogenase
VINQVQAKKISSYVQGGIKQGATLLTGGELAGPNNTFISPTILTDCDNSMDIMREEVFGPVLAAARFDDYDTVLAQANDSDYGLAASVWTEGLSNGLRMSEDLNVGTVWINSHLMYDAALPIGGYKQSGWGRDSGQQASNNYLELKTICAIY